MKQKKLFTILIAIALLSVGIYTLLIKTITITTYPSSAEVWLDGNQVSASTPTTLHLWRWQTYHLELKPLEAGFGGYNPVTYDFLGQEAPGTLSVFLQSFGYTATSEERWLNSDEASATVIAYFSTNGEIIKTIKVAPESEFVDGQLWQNRPDSASVSADGSMALLEAYLADKSKTCGKMGANLDTFLWLIPLDHPEDRYPILKDINPDGSSCMIGGGRFSSKGKWITASPAFLDDATREYEHTLWVVSTVEGAVPQMLLRDSSISGHVIWSLDEQQMTVCRSTFECSFYELDEKGVWQETGVVLQGTGVSWVDNDRLWYVNTSQAEQSYFSLYQRSSQQELLRTPLDDALEDIVLFDEARQDNLLAMCLNYETPNSKNTVHKLVIASSGTSPKAVVINLESSCRDPYFLEDGTSIAFHTATDRPLEDGGTFYHTEIRDIPPELLH